VATASSSGGNPLNEDIQTQSGKTADSEFISSIAVSDDEIELIKKSVRQEGDTISEKKGLAEICKKPFNTFHQGNQIYFVVPKKPDGKDDDPIVKTIILLAELGGYRMVRCTEDVPLSYPKREQAAFSSARQFSRVLVLGTEAVKANASSAYKKFVGTILRRPMKKWCEENKVPYNWSYGTTKGGAAIIAKDWTLKVGGVSVQRAIDLLFSRVSNLLKVDHPERLLLPREQIISERVAHRVIHDNRGVFTPTEIAYFKTKVPNLDRNSLKAMKLEEFITLGQEELNSYSKALTKLNGITQVVFDKRQPVLFPKNSRFHKSGKLSLEDKIAALDGSTLLKRFAPSYLDATFDWEDGQSRDDLRTKVQDHHWSCDEAKAVAVEFMHTYCEAMSQE
jgi:hypothetical protein